MPFRTESVPITVDGETVERPTLVEGPVSRHKVLNKAPAKPLVGDVVGFDRGHIFAESLGGQDTSENVVPMHSTFHQAGGVWRHLEEFIYTLKENNVTADVQLKVKVDYAGNSLIPSGFSVTVTCTRPGMAAEIPEFGEKKLHDCYIRHNAQQPVQVNCRTHPLFKHVIEARTKMEASGWHVENDKTLRWEGKTPYVPDISIHRPYEVLDYLCYTKPTIMNKYIGKLDIGKGRAFNKKQKELICLTNRMFNGGNLITDYEDDEVQSPLPSGVGGRDAAQIDHMIPEAFGGSNLFSNAAVASGKHNNNKRTSLDKLKIKRITSKLTRR